MAVLTKEQLLRLKDSLRERYVALFESLNGRELKHTAEGCPPRKHWGKPELMTHVDTLHANLALSDFEAILKEIRKAVKG